MKSLMAHERVYSKRLIGIKTSEEINRMKLELEAVTEGLHHLKAEEWLNTIE
jgi:hypothetical protein